MSTTTQNPIIKFLRFPICRMIVGLVVVIGVVALGQMGVQFLLDLLSVNAVAGRMIKGLAGAMLAIGSYWLLFKYYEQRMVTELALNRIGRNLTLGLLLGFCLQSLTILVIYIFGHFNILSVNPVSYLIPALTMAFTSAILEEVIIRGIIFRIMEEKLGSFIALVISALLFGALHLGNPNSTLAAALGLALQAGFFLAAAFIFSRNLWFPIAIHFAWNFTQGGIYGAAVSGNATSRSLFSTEIRGADWYTGGAFGPEGSIQATVFCFGAALVLLIIARQQGRIVAPFWKKRSDVLSASQIVV